MAELNLYSKIILHDNKRFLTGVFEKLPNEPVTLDNDEYIALTAQAYLLLKKKLHSDTQAVIMLYYIDNDFNKDIVEWEDVHKLDVEDSALPDNLDLYKNRMFNLASDSIRVQLNISSAVLFLMTKINNVLSAKGIFITDENREEKYLEVIQMNDEKLLECLSTYLDILDTYSAIENTFGFYLAFTEKVNIASTIEEVNKAYDEFIRVARSL